ncbi:MAG: hypothetical protein HRU70_04965 [Phycisphaeraceae bacterium]|nr:MAG: hypothetical protein HRU70_04965 [Phycisphaeraceae bacterium]
MTHVRRSRPLVMIVAALGALAASRETLAQPGEAPKPPTPLRDLDDLLGTREAGRPSSDPASKADLERALSPAEQREEFEQAIDLMKRSADAVENESEVGLPTQRMQEDALRKLDKLIDEARRQRQQNQNQQSQQSQQRPRPQDQQSQPQPQSSRADQTDPSSRAGQEAGPGPIGQNPSLRPPLAGSAAWGNLAPHIREALSQGSSDRFSSVYRQLTEAYYRRLAEEPKP